MNVTLKTAPTLEPVTEQEVMDHLRISTSDEVASVAGWISAAREWVEAYTDRSLMTQTWQLSLPSMPRKVWLPRATPLASVTHVKYYDDDNTLQTWSSANYFTPSFEEPASIEVLDTATVPSIYSRSDAVQIEYIAGATTASSVPKPLVQAILMLVGHWYEHRESVLVGTISKEIEFAVTALCSPYRRWWRPPCL